MSKSTCHNVYMHRFNDIILERYLTNAYSLNPLENTLLLLIIIAYILQFKLQEQSVARPEYELSERERELYDNDKELLEALKENKENNNSK